MSVGTKLYNISFDNEVDEFRAFSELVKAGTAIRNVDEMQYLMTRGQCDLLSYKGIKYKILRTIE